jgi:hypothetical protein
MSTGRDLPTWPSSSTPTRGGSWAGESRRRRPPQWCSTRSSRPSGADIETVSLISKMLSTIRIEDYSSRRSGSAARRSRHPTLGRGRGQLLRRRTRRDDQRPVQDRADQTRQAMAHHRGRRTGHRTMGAAARKTGLSVTGSTTTASTSTAETSRRGGLRPPTTLSAGDELQADVPDQEVSGLTGAVQSSWTPLGRVCMFAHTRSV